MQMSSRQEIVLSANCNCSGETDVDGTVDGVIDSSELDNVIQSTVNVSPLNHAGVKVQLPDELLNT